MAKKKEQNQQSRTRKIRILGILLFAFGVMLFISLIGHRSADDMQIRSDEAVYGNPFTLAYANPGGMMGAYLSYILYFFLGWSAVFGAIFVGVLGVKLAGLDLGRRLLKHAALVWCFVFQILVLFDIPRLSSGQMSLEVPDGSGAIGQVIVELFLKLVGSLGAVIVVIATLVSTVVFYASVSHRFRNVMTAIEDRIMVLVRHIGRQLQPHLADLKEKFNFKNRLVVRGTEFKKELKRAKKQSANGRTDDSPLPPEEPEKPDVVVHQESASDEPMPARAKQHMAEFQKGGGQKIPDHGVQTTPSLSDETTAPFIKPDIDLLKVPDAIVPAYDEKELPEVAKSLRETLETFGVKLSGNIEMYPGPVITRFEVKPAAGVKVNQIANLSEDLALNLRAKSIRIVAPIPGKGAVGIEIPNRNPQTVYIRDILKSDEFRHNSFHLPLALGKDISGKPFVTDLASMPHLLIAGTTGSGKSVCINTIITSLLFWHHPKNLKFVFIDPKMLELTVYKGIPHLLEKVVTNPKRAERVLNEIVVEMEQRYKKLAAASVRSIVDYNNKQETAETKLPYIIIIIDELADLMMSTQSSRVELLITRLAQMARAVGIHLILATQRPSVDVITGLIKANFPSRIAFQVASKTDSRTILDGNGAERLLGRGDMLFLESGSPEPARLHGAFIGSDETEAVVSFITSQAYSQQKVVEAAAMSEEKAQMSQLSDPVLVEAIETVVHQGQASVSLLQRKLGIGYQRAARLIDELEAMKIIGSYNESKAREVLADKTYLENLKSGKIAKP